jgi:hypothetical protein
MLKQFLFLSSLMIFTILIFSCQDATMPQNTSEPVQLDLKQVGNAQVNKITYIDEGYWEATGECLGEMLGITYRERYTIHTTLDGHGGYHMIMQIKPLDPYIAIGLTTGRSWSPVGHFASIEHSGQVNSVYTMSGCYNWKSQQPGEPNLTEPWVLHTTVNANGEVTADFVRQRFICN